MPLVVVRDTLGHTQIGTTADIYGHVLPDTHRQAVDGLDALLGGATDDTEDKCEDDEQGSKGERDKGKENDPSAS